MKPVAINRHDEAATTRPLDFVRNAVKVALCCAWTSVVGVPLLVVVYTRYWLGRVCKVFGRVDLFDRLIEANANFAGRVAQRLWANVLLAIIEVPLRCRQAVQVDWASSHVVCANHASLLDILALIRVVPPPFRFVAKRELTRWPIVGWALRPAGQIVVDRGDHSGAIATLAEAAGRKIRGQVIFFVEGTRSRSGQLQPFKKGAFHFAIRNRLPVLPAAIRGSYDALARLPWWQLHAGTEIDVHFCEPIAAPPDSPASTDFLAAEVERLRSATRAAIQHELEACEA